VVLVEERLGQRIDDVAGNVVVGEMSGELGG